MEPIYTRAATLLVASALFAGGELNHPTGTQGVIMIDKLGAQIRFFDPVSFTEIATIGREKNPHDFVLSADHKFAYVPIYGDGVYGKNPNPGHEIDVIDLAAHTIAKKIDIAPTARRMASRQMPRACSTSPVIWTVRFW